MLSTAQGFKFIVHFHCQHRDSIVPARRGSSERLVKAPVRCLLGEERLFGDLVFHGLQGVDQAFVFVLDGLAQVGDNVVVSTVLASGRVVGRLGDTVLELDGALDGSVELLRRLQGRAEGGLPQLVLL